MKCRSCGSVLTQRNAHGEPIIRNRGLVAKPTGLHLICPKCKSAVPCSPDLLAAMMPDFALIRRRMVAPDRS